MKRSTIYLYLSVWSASIALSFFVGRVYTSKNISPEQIPSASQQTTQRLSQAERDNSQMIAELDPSTAADAVEDDTTALAVPEKQTAAMTRSLLAAAFDLPISDPNRMDKIQDLLEQLATTDPLEALKLADGIPSLRDAERARNNILEVWASSAPMAALAWAQSTSANTPTSLHNSQMRAIMRGFAETNPKAAFNYANALNEATAPDLRLKNRLLAEVIQTQIRGGGLAQAQTSIALMSDGPTKENLQRELIDEWAAFDPASAANYVQSLGNSASSDVKISLIDQWSRSDPAAAAEWIGTLAPEDPAYSRGMAQITREWTRYDLTASSDWLNTLPASPELDRAVATYTYRAAQEDPDSAMSWAESINDDKIRNRMMQQVAASWRDDDPVGFNAYLNKSDLTTEQRAELESAKSWRGGERGWGNRND